MSFESHALQPNQRSIGEINCSFELSQCCLKCVASRQKSTSNGHAHLHVNDQANANDKARVMTGFLMR